METCGEQLLRPGEGLEEGGEEPQDREEEVRNINLLNLVVNDFINRIQLNPAL